MDFLPDTGAPYRRMQPAALTSAAPVTTFCYQLTINPVSISDSLGGLIQPDEFSRVEPQLGDALQKLRPQRFADLGRSRKKP